MQIHATNIQGLGASQVAKSFLDSCNKLGYLKKAKVYLPTDGPLANFDLRKVTVIRYNRRLINAVSRFLECIFSKFIFSNTPTIVLGDIPLRGIYNQIVLVHQSNLIYPRVNSFSSKKINFRVNRFLFSINHKYAKRIIVQTEAMADELILSYPKVKDKIKVCPQPVPNWLDQNNSTKQLSKKSVKLKLFYPAAFYPHKKHDFLLKINEYCVFNKIDINRIEIWLTLNTQEFKPFEQIKWIKNLGSLNAEEMNLNYNKADALLFLSSMESYGLPLIEAVTIGLPILTVDFKYSRWVCEEEGYYFKPYSETDFLKKIDVLISNFKLNISPDYKNVLNKFPASWDEVVNVFVKELEAY